MLRTQLLAIVSMSILIAAATAPSDAKSTKSAPEHTETRLLQFDGDVSLGKLFLDPKDRSSEDTYVGEARGKITVDVPSSSYLMLYAGTAVSKSPPVIRKAAATPIDGLRLKFCSFYENNSITDAVLREAEVLKNLKYLDLAQSDISENGAIASLPSFKKLEHINFFTTSINGECLKDLAKLPGVTDIDLSFTNLNQENLIYLTEFRNLKVLNIRGTHLTDAAIKTVGKCSTLESLLLGRNKFVDDRCLDNLLPLQKLRNITLDDTVVTKAGVLKLRALKSLSSIELPPSIHAQDLDDLKAKFPRCELKLSSPHKRKVDSFEKHMFAPLK
ncbi:MAG TPA: hypothetical protein V6C86_15010 [Oculatellaceae cyanobacterium]